MLRKITLTCGYSKNKNREQALFFVSSLILVRRTLRVLFSPADVQKIQSKLWIFIHILGESGGARTLDTGLKRPVL